MDQAGNHGAVDAGGALDLALDRPATAPRGPATALPPAVTPHTFIRWLTTPWVDKTFAILAILPFVYPLAVHFRHYFRMAEAVFLAENFLLIGTMVFRRPAVRVSTNFLHWLAASLGSYWGFLTLSIEQPGHLLVSPWIAIPFYPCSMVLVIWARISLGKNIALLPAQRQIVETGPYRWMRHPIYTSFFLVTVSAVLQAYSLRNLLLYLLGSLWFVLRTLAEEDFLRLDPKYSAYMKRVRWRWVPGLI